MKTLFVIVAALCFAGCCKTASTYKSLTPGCSPRAGVSLELCVFVGETGKPGPDGPCALALTGPQGRDGDQGPRGPDGLVIRGPVGADGGPGVKGASLLAQAGPQGDIGPQGDRGPSITGPQGQPGSPGRAGASVVGIVGLKGRQGPKGPAGRVGQVCWSLYRTGSNINVGEAAAFIKANPSVQIKVTGDQSLREQLIQAGVTADRITFEAGGSPQLFLRSQSE